MINFDAIAAYWVLEAGAFADEAKDTAATSPRVLIVRRCSDGPPKDLPFFLKPSNELRPDETEEAPGAPAKEKRSRPIFLGFV